MFIEKTESGIPFFEPFCDVPFCRAAVLTRAGGVSEGHLSTLNVGIQCGDTAEHIEENMRRIGKAIGFSPMRMVFTNQTHSAAVRHVTAEDAGTGFSRPRFLEDADALITSEPNLPLFAYFADCVPVLFCDSVQKAVGICHSGWRGTVQEIAGRVVSEMQKTFGTNPKDIRAAIGPHIGSCCFAVDAPVYEAFYAAFPKDGGFAEKRGEKYHISLASAVRHTLEKAGVLEISDIGLCTACHSERFFSHRKTGGKRGLFGAVIFRTEE